MFGEQKKQPTQEVEIIAPKFNMGPGNVPPTLSDCEEMYKKSNQNRDSVVEWKWKDEAVGKTYRLVVIYPFVRESDWWDYERRDDPTWHLYDDRAQGNPVIWEYKSGDYQLALEIVQMVGTRDGKASVSVGETDQVASSQLTVVFADSVFDLAQSVPRGAPPTSPQDLCGIFRAAANAFFSGCVDVITEFSYGRIFFANGAPSHATAGGAVGDQAVREIISWQVARVVFAKDETADARTVCAPLEYLIREAANLLEQKRYLTNFGLCYEFSLTRAPDSARQAATLQGGLYQMLYSYFDERKHTLADCVRDLRLEPCDWAPAIAYMLGQRLLQAHPPHLSRSHGLRFLGAGRNAIEEQAAKLLSPRIGIFKYTSLLLLLKRELLLHRRVGAPFSLISFEFQAPDDSYGAKLKWLSAEMVKAVAQKFDLLKRPLDVFAHFESLEYALLLPNTDLAQAKIMANILLQSLVKIPIAGSDEPLKVNGVCGIATFPVHGANLERFLSCAKLARKEAKRLGLPMATTTADELAVWEVDNEERIQAERSREKTLRPQRFPTGKEPPKVVEMHVERPFELPDLLIRSGLVTPDHIEQVRQLMASMNLGIDRVLAMQGHIQAHTVLLAGEVLSLIKDGTLPMEDGIKAAQLIGNSGLDIDTALRRIGRGKISSRENLLAALLQHTRFVRNEDVQRALRESANTGLPAGYILAMSGMITKALWSDCLSALVRVRAGADTIEEAARSIKENGTSTLELSKLETLLLSSAALSEVEFLTVREVQIVDGQKFQALVEEYGLVSNACMDAARQLVGSVESGDLTMPCASFILKKIRHLSNIEDLAKVVAQMKDEFAEHPTATSGPGSDQTRVLAKYCKEHTLNYQDGLRIFGWDKALSPAI